MSNRLDLRRRVRSVAVPHSAKSRRAKFAAASRSRQSRLEQLEARLALTADLEELTGFAGEGKRPLARPDLQVEIFERSSGPVTRSILPGELVLAMEGDVSLEIVRDRLRESLHLTQLDTGGSIRLDYLLTSAPSAESPTTLFRLQLGEFQNVRIAGNLISQRIPGVAWATPNYAYHGPMLEFIPNDPLLLTSQYGLGLIEADLAWDLTLGSPSVIVAITDNGMQLNHEDLAPNLWVNSDEIPGNSIDDDNNGYIDDVNGWDFVTDDNDPSPFDSVTDTHGTAVAGVIGARTNNAIGISGTAGLSTLMPLRVLGSDLDITSTGLLESFAYAADNGAQIVNTSLYLDDFIDDLTINAAMQYLYDNEVLSISSSGNFGELNPARQKFHQTLLVAGTTVDQIELQEVPAAYSNYGTGIDISAPGDFIFTTLPGDATSPNGTYDLFDFSAPGTALEGSSMAAGFVSGVAALIWAANPTYTRDQVAARLIGTADSLDALNPDFAGLLGSGRVNANVAVNSTLIPLPAPRLKGIREVTPGQALLPLNQLNVGLANVLDKTTVETAANWSLVGAGPDNNFGTGDDVPVVLTRVNPYLIGANEVTFSVPLLAPGSYRFTAVSGGLRDPFNTALDGDGNGTAGGNFVQDFTITAGTVVYAADFSDAGGAPSAEGFISNGPANQWHLSTGRGADPGHSADDSMYFGTGEGPTGGGTYAVDADGSLISPEIDLSRFAGPILLTFNSLVDVEDGFDYADILVINGNGRRYVATSDNLFAAQVGIPLFESETGGWVPLTVDLSDFAGQKIQLQFQLTSDDSISLEGWYLDDITILAANPLPSANLSGQVWNDVNANRVRDAGDDGTAGWTVYHDANNNNTLDTALAVNVPSADVPQVISNGNFIDSIIAVSGIAGTIIDVDVSLDITHTYVSDVEIFLVSPAGTRIRLAGEEGADDADNYTNTRFDDEATVSIVGAAAPFTGTFRPESTSGLTIFDGTSANGDWHLEVGDYFLFDTGVLNSWTLHFTIAEPSRISGVNGDYAFNNVAPGSYVIREVTQPPLHQTVPATGFYNVTVTNGQTLSNLDFANSTNMPAATFQVTTLTPTATGFVVDFNRDLNLDDLNLYTTVTVPSGPADIVLLPDGSSIPVRGSIVADPNLRKLTFVATEGLLPAGVYNLTLVSATNGFKDSTDALLDGNADGTPGGNYTAPITIVAPPANAVRLSVPNFARGPGQPVNLPITETTGIPVSFSDGNGITTANFQLAYDPTLLNVTGVTVAPGLTGATVTTTGSTPGTLLVQFSSPTPLAAGTTRFVDLQANVPNTAPYRSKTLLDFGAISLNGGAILGVDDDSVMVSAYFGDVSGDGTYGSVDASRTAFVSTSLDGGFAQFALLDPVIMGDVTLALGISSQDVTRITQAAVNVAVPNILRPLPGVTLAPGGPDPKLSIPQDLTAAPGERIQFPVMIDSIIHLAGEHGLEGADLVIYFDPTVLEVNSLSPGSLIREPGWFHAAQVDNRAGRILVSLAGPVKIEGQFIGELLAINATVKADAPTGASALNLAEAARGTEVSTRLNEGYLTLIPAPTNAANDPVDGVLTVIAPPVTPAASDQPAASVVDGQLLILGTSGADRMLVAPVGNNQVRVRSGNQILGTFSAPNGIALDLLGGQDYAYVAPSIAKTVVATSVDTAAEDALYGGANSLLVDDHDLVATAWQIFQRANTAAELRAARDLALLDLVAQWSNQSSDPNRVFGRLIG